MRKHQRTVRIEFTRWGMELTIMELVIRLVAGDVFLRVPMVGQLVWNQCGLSVDRWTERRRGSVWADVKDEASLASNTVFRY